MQSNIEIKFLSPKEMADAGSIDWRYSRVDKDNLGFADKAKNRVFVRSGLDSELTKYLVNHEISHLFEMEGTDEDENGIRHKKKGGFMSWLLPTILAIGGTLIGGPAGTAIGSSLGTALGLGGGAVAGGALGTGLGATLGGVTGSSLTGKPNWAQNAISGAGAAAGSAAGNWLGGFGDVTGVRQGLGTPITVTGARNTGSGLSSMMAGIANIPGATGLFGRAAGTGVETGLGMLSSPRSPNFGGMFTGLDWSGFGNNVPIPASRPGFGLPGAAGGGSRGSTEQGFGEGIKTPGLGQMGITLGGGKQSPQGMQGLEQTGQNMQNNPMAMMGFNAMNKGMLNF